jgi:cytosine/uracil/thiamine/allantoin permease
VLFVQNFTTALNDFVSMLIVWLGPFAGVWMIDGILRRWRYDPAAAHATKDPRGRYWGWHGINLRGFVALLAGVGTCLLTVNSPVYAGPVSKALAGADLSWFLGFAVSGVVYLLLARQRVQRAGSETPAVLEVPGQLAEVRAPGWSEHGTPGHAAAYPAAASGAAVADGPAATDTDEELS